MPLHVQSTLDRRPQASKMIGDTYYGWCFFAALPLSLWVVAEAAKSLVPFSTSCLTLAVSPLPARRMGGAGGIREKETQE